MKKSIIVLLHLGYWFMYILLIVFFLIAFNTQEQDIPSTSILFNIFCTPVGAASLIPAFTGFYGFYSILFNRYLTKKKILMLFAGAISICIAGSVITQTFMYFVFRPPVYHINWSFSTIFSAGLFLAFIALINGIIGLVMKGFITWYNEITLKSELNKKNYDMEVALIQSQINPHFLFNTINNIDVLIQKDAGKASEYLNKLSDILRFTLYDSKADTIELSKELTYITKFIELQKIRTANPNYINYSVEGNTEGILVEPMLFIPFIENAFKHSENKKTENAVKIYIKIEKHRLHFICENNHEQISQVKPEHSGLGNELIKRRLALLYPGRHTLEVSDTSGVYKINLVLSLKK